jgi:hypothetical protein
VVLLIERANRIRGDTDPVAQVVPAIEQRPVLRVLAFDDLRQL